MRSSDTSADLQERSQLYESYLVRLFSRTLQSVIMPVTGTRLEGRSARLVERLTCAEVMQNAYRSLKDKEKKVKGRKS